MLGVRKSELGIVILNEREVCLMMKSNWVLRYTQHDEMRINTNA